MPNTLAAQTRQTTARLPLLDELRGLLILNVVAYHTLYDLVYLFGLQLGWFRGTGAFLWQQWMSGSLIFLSGISCLLSRSNLRRGAKALALGLALTAATLLVMPGERILFGILHFFGCAMLLFGLAAPLLQKIPDRVGFWACLALFVFTKHLPNGSVGLPGLVEIALPQWLYSTPFLFPLGLPGPSFYSADYFPLVPWLFLFLAGSFWGRKIPRGRVPAFARRSHLPLLGKIGRHTMLIYLAHQPVIYALLIIIFSILKV